MTDHVFRRKATVRLLEWFGKFIIWALAYTTVPEPTHAIIRPKRAVTPQLNLNKEINNPRLRTNKLMVVMLIFRDSISVQSYSS